MNPSDVVELAKQLDSKFTFLEHGYPEDDKSVTTRFILESEKYRYFIVANIEDPDRTYLGCIVECRYPYPGENWCRGNDLADGDLSVNTWDAIVDDIEQYELH